MKTYEFDNADNSYLPPYFREAVAVLQQSQIPKASVDVFSSFLKQIPIILSTAFELSVVRKGWTLTGTYPLSCSKILHRCIGFNVLSHSVKASIVKELPNLVSIARNEGMLTDEQIKLQFEHIPEVTTPIQNMDSRIFTQQRVMWVNKDTVLNKRRMDNRSRRSSYLQ